MQIIIPMGGAGRRFVQAGYSRPKPFIEFHQRTMIEHVVANLGVQNQFTLVVQREHYVQYHHVFDQIKTMVESLEVVLLDQLTNGAAESCLIAKSSVEQRQPLMIANCDQIMIWNPLHFHNWFLNSPLDGVIVTYFSQHPKNSYAKVNSQGLVVKTVEKQVISEHASNGIYVWKQAQDFFSAAQQMIDLDMRENNEYYVCPTFNWNIAQGHKIGIYKLNDGCHWPIGTPEDLCIYLDQHSHDSQPR